MCAKKLEIHVEKGATTVFLRERIATKIVLGGGGGKLVLVKTATTIRLYFTFHSYNKEKLLVNQNLGFTSFA